MAPHIEEYKQIPARGDTSSGTWVEVPNSDHLTNDPSLSTLICHLGVKLNPDKYREVRDHYGPVCDTMKKLSTLKR